MPTEKRQPTPEEIQRAEKFMTQELRDQSQDWKRQVEVQNNELRKKYLESDLYQTKLRPFLEKETEETTAVEKIIFALRCAQTEAVPNSGREILLLEKTGHEDFSYSEKFAHKLNEQLRSEIQNPADLDKFFNALMTTIPFGDRGPYKGHYPMVESLQENNQSFDNDAFNALARIIFETVEKIVSDHLTFEPFEFTSGRISPNAISEEEMDWLFAWLKHCYMYNNDLTVTAAKISLAKPDHAKSVAIHEVLFQKGFKAAPNGFFRRIKDNE